MRSGATIIGLALLAMAMAYTVVTLIAVLTWRIRVRWARTETASQLPPISILKPLCGSEPGLHAQLRSFCQQDYPQFQIVFGLRDANDPALAVARQLQSEFAQLPIDIAIDAREYGGNRKSSNLINMLPHARYDVIIIADSDTLAPPDYLRTVVAPLRDETVGLVTSTYYSAPTSLVWSRLGAMYVNEWYMPSVLLTWLFGYRGYASGQTLCLRRATLEAIGGFSALADHLADDYRLGELVRALGQRIVLSPARVVVEQHEPSFEALEAHEMRWMHTLRVLRPRSFRLLFLSFSVPLGLLGLLLCTASSGLSNLAWGLCAGTALARLGLHLAYRSRAHERNWSDLWLLLVRDLLLCWVWLRTFFASRIVWRDHEFAVGADGVIQSEP